MTKEIAVKYLYSIGINAPSDIGIRVAALLEEWEGLHHFEQGDLRKAKFTDSYHVALTCNWPLDTFDFDRLTRLVFLAHDHCVRVQVTGKPGPSRYTEIMFHGRERTGGFSHRHPTIEDALTEWRQRHPVAELEQVAK